MSDREEVLVFKEELLKELGEFNGVSTETEKYLHTILQDRELFFHDRQIAETNPLLKQLIPYCVVCRDNEVFVYERTKKGGESRLHNKLSLGVGGHINPPDAGPNGVTDLYWNGLARELKEELLIDGAWWNQIVGMLYDPSNEVGQVHFGIVHKILLDDHATVKAVEDHLTNGAMRSKMWIHQNAERFENWSQLVMDNFDRLKI